MAQPIYARSGSLGLTSMSDEIAERDRIIFWLITQLGGAVVIDSNEARLMLTGPPGRVTKYIDEMGRITIKIEER